MRKSLHVIKRFTGEEVAILPPPVAADLAGMPLVSDLFFTGTGYFPTAESLYRTRSHGYRDFLLIFCVSGQGWFEIGGPRQDLKQDYVLMIPAGLPHAYGPKEADPWTLHWVAFNGVNAMEYARQLPANRYAIPVGHQTKAEVLGLFAKLYAILCEDVSTPHLLCASKIVELILGLLFFHNPALRAGRWGAPDATTRAIQHMRQRLNGTVQLAELARRANLSVTHFSRMFKQRTGYSPVDYFIRLKVQRACQYLSSTDHPIKAIADYLGYEDPA